MRFLQAFACVVIAVALASGMALGQVTGTKTIGVDYASLNAALIDLNTNGVGSGGVIINVPAGWTETAPAGGDSLGSATLNASTSASNPILIQKSGGGANPLITAFTPGTSTTVDGIFKIKGTDYVTIDGIDLVDTNTVSRTTKMEWGYALVKLARSMSANPADTVDGCQYITIKNCTINLSRTNIAPSVGIYANNHRSTTTTAFANIVAVTGATSSLDIYSNTVNNCYSGISITEGSQFLGLNNYIGVNGANTVTNWGADSSTAGNGIFATQQNNLKIDNNIVNGGSRRMTGAATGILFQTGAGATAEINNNTITVVDSTITTNAGIRNGAGTTIGGTITISGNIIQNCYTTGAGGSMNGIISSGSPLNLIITNNTINGFSLPGAPIVSSGSLFGIATSGSAVNITISTNNVTNFTVPTNSTGTIYGYQLSVSTGSFPTIMTVSNNTVSSLSGGTSTSSFVYGMNVTNGSASGGITSVYGNTIQNLRAYSMSASGIRCLGNGFGSTSKIYQNTISNIVDSVGTNTALTVSGVYYSTNANFNPSYGYVYNNFVSDLRSPAAVSLPNATGFGSTNPPYSILGIFAVNSSGTGGSFFSAYNNTVYLNASSTGATFGTAGILENTLYNTDLRNNIIVNLSTPGSSAGSTVAHARIDNVTASLPRYGLTSYLGTSNNNNFYVSAGARRYIYGDSLSIASGSADASITAYKTRMETKDIQSFSELSPFVNVATTPYDLHMQAVATQVEGGGTPITTPIAVTNDYDGNARASWPDVGADEFSGTAIDSTSPTIVYTPFNAISPIAAHTLNAMITDPAGVPTIGIGLPALYYKVNVAGTYTLATGTSLGSGQYSFAFSPSAVTGDTVFYYVAAQDGAGTPNAGSVKYGGGFTANPPAASIPPGSANWYRVVASPLSGDYTIGTVSSNYTTIKNAINDLNLRGVGGNVRFLLDTTSFTESTPDTIKIRSDSITTASKTVTIKPNTGIVATITDSIANDGVFDIFNPYITIDGDNGSGGRNLTIKNAHAGNNNSPPIPPTYAVGLVNGGGIYVPSNSTIKNCNITGGTSAYGFNMTCGIYLNGNGGGGYNNILLDNNGITKVNQGIQFSGASTSFATNGQITNNTIGSGTSALSCFLQGIVVSYSDNLIISGNEIMGQAVGNPNGGTSPQGANSGIVVTNLSTGTRIRKNKIHDFFVTGLNSFGSIGIVIDPGVAVNSGTTEISNNIIYNIKGDCNTEVAGTGAMGAVTQGICVNSTGTAPVQIYSNSIYLSGAFLGTTFSGRSFNGSSACIGIRGGSVGAGTMDIRNNVLKNSQTRVDTSTPSGNGAHAMGVWVQAVTSTNAIFGNIDYNDYNPDGVRPLVGWLGGQDTTLTQWQTATAKDANSRTGNPQFVSTTDLHVNTSAATPSVAANVGSSATGITADYDGDTRTGTPDIGADEFMLAAPVAFNQVTPVNSALAEPLSGSLTWNPSLGASAYDIFMDINPVPVTLLAGNVTDTTTLYAGLNPGTQYYWKVVAKNVDGTTAATGSPFSFTTVAPLFTLAPPSFAFGNVVVATSKLDSTWVHNPGTMSLTIDSVLSSDAQFVVSPTGPLSVAAGDSAKFYVTFTPTVVGSYSPSIVFYHSAATSPDTLAVTGGGIPVPVPEFSVSPVNHNFGNVIVGDSSSVVLRVKNVGTDTLNVSGVISDSASFTVDPSSGMIVVGDSADFTVEFKPTLVQPYGGNIVFTHDAASSPDTVTLSGTGVPVPVLTTFRVDMRPKMLDGVFLPDSDYVEVRGSFNGWSAGDTLTDGNGDSIYTKTLSLQPNTSYDYKFYKSPRGAYGWEDGISNRNVMTATADTVLPAPYFNDDDFTVPATFSVNMKIKMIEGTFTPPAQGVFVRGNFNNWSGPVGPMTDGNNDSIYTFTVGVPSGKLLEYKFWADPGLGWESVSNRQFSVLSNTPPTLPVWYFDDDSIANVPGFLASPSSIAFGSVEVADTVADSIYVYNTGLASLNISSVTSNNSTFTVTPNSGTLAIGESLLVVVFFNPDSAQAESGTITFTHDAAGSPGIVNVSGTGYFAPPQYFLSLSPDSVFNEDPLKPGKSKKPVKHQKHLYPNWSNLLDEVNAQGGFAPGTSESDSAGAMVIGTSYMFNAGGPGPAAKWKAVKDSAKIYAWVRLAKWDVKKTIGKSFANIQKTLRDKTIGFHTGPASGLDTTTDGKFKKLVKQLTALTPKKQNNKLFAELVALKFNIAASAMGKTPAGFGDLIFDVNGNQFDEMTVADISAAADNMMTHWSGFSQDDFDSLYSAVYNINRAFLGPLDTLAFDTIDSLHVKGKLVVAGQVDVNTLTILKLPTPFVATRILALNSEVESPEDFETDDDAEFDPDAMPVAAQLMQNYPNPFNPSTTIAFRLKETSKVTIRIFNLLGQEVATLVNGEELEGGTQTLQFSADQLSSGVYFYRIDAQGLEESALKSVETRKMVLLK